jgi:hypothetical protein
MLWDAKAGKTMKPLQDLCQPLLLMPVFYLDLSFPVRWLNFTLELQEAKALFFTS